MKIRGSWFFCRVISSFFWVALCFAHGVQAEFDEALAEVVGKDVQQRQLKLSSLMLGDKLYKLSFDAEITLANGDLGTIANIREKDLVALVIDRESREIKKLGVLRKR